MSEAIGPLSSIDAAEIRERVRAAGVVGAGGAGFPTHIKLQARVDTVLVNAAECEPMLKVDQQLMAQQADRLIRGLGYAMTATGAREGIIALKAKYAPAIAALPHDSRNGPGCIFCLTSIRPGMRCSLSGWRRDAAYHLPRCRSASAWWSITCRRCSISPEPWNRAIR